MRGMGRRIDPGVIQTGVVGAEVVVAELVGARVVLVAGVDLGVVMCAEVGSGGGVAAEVSSGVVVSTEVTGIVTMVVGAAGLAERGVAAGVGGGVAASVAPSPPAVGGRPSGSSGPWRSTAVWICLKETVITLMPCGKVCSMQSAKSWAPLVTYRLFFCVELLCGNGVLGERYLPGRRIGYSSLPF